MNPTSTSAKRHINGLASFIHRHKHEILLFSFLLLIFGDTFTTHHLLTSVIFIYLNFITGFIIFYDNKIYRVIIFSIILVNASLDVFAGSLKFINPGAWHGINYLIFFSLVVKQVFSDVLYVKTVSRELLAAALCGFVLLCLIASFIFLLVDIQFPNSFSNIGSGPEIRSNLTYFSFTTLLTTGYGDITPITFIAKRAVMLVGLAGHFYTVFIIGIIIGKYLSFKK